MSGQVFAQCVEEMCERADPTPAVDAATRGMRRRRAEQLDEVDAVVNGASFYAQGFRSPTDWLVVTTREGVGSCKLTLHLADRIQRMPQVHATFARGDLDAEGFALLREAIRLYAQPAESESRSAAQRRADALVTIARMAIEHHSPVAGKKRRKPRVVATASYDDLASAWHHQQRRSRSAEGDSDPDVVDTPCDTDVEPTVRPLGGSLDTDTDRTVVPAEAIRRMACDCNVHRYITDPLGTVIDAGRAHRVASDSMFDNLHIRDHGCRWPGCGIPAGGCDAHHAIHWLDHGETEPDNLVLLCWFHHHLLHEQHWSITPLGGGHFNLDGPHGGERLLRPPLVGLALPTEPSAAVGRPSTT